MTHWSPTIAFWPWFSSHTGPWPSHITAWPGQQPTLVVASPHRHMGQLLSARVATQQRGWARRSRGPSTEPNAPMRACGQYGCEGVDSCTHQIHVELTSFDVLPKSMTPRTKKVAHKRLRQDKEPTPPQEMKFIKPEYQLRFEHLQKLKFGLSHQIDWDTLDEIRLTDEVRELTDMGDWDQLLTIRDSIGCKITLEVLSSFFIDRSRVDTDFDKENNFRL